MGDPEPATALSHRQIAVLLSTVLIVAVCGIVYELIIATVSTYLVGNSVYQFSITIGLFMLAMGVGSYLTKFIQRDLIDRFVLIEIAISLVGGISSTLLFIVFPYNVFYHPVMYGLILAVGTLVGLEIPVITRIVSQAGPIRSSLANVLTMDYVGALIGSVTFPIVLLPFLGLFRASFLVGLLNVAVALVNVVTFARVIRRPVLMGTITVAIGVTLATGMVLSSVLAGYAEGQLFRDSIIYREQTPYQRIIVTRSDFNGRIRLFLDGHLQFAEQDEHRYHEALVHPVMSVPGRPRRILVLGGGDGLVVRELLKYGDRVEHIDLVDIDPAVTRLASTFEPIRRLNGGSLSDPRVSIHHEDAFNFVRRAGIIYDRVIIDLPDPHNEALNKLYSVEFYRGLRRRMSDEGCFVTQSSSPFFARDVFWCIARTIEEAGMETYSYRITLPSFGIWGFTLAAVDGPAPKTFDIIDRTRYLTPQVMAAAGAFGKDSGPPGNLPVNSMFEPRLYHLYMKAMRR